MEISKSIKQIFRFYNLSWEGSNKWRIIYTFIYSSWDSPKSNWLFLLSSFPKGMGSVFFFLLSAWLFYPIPIHLFLSWDYLPHFSLMAGVSRKKMIFDFSKFAQSPHYFWPFIITMIIWIISCLNMLMFPNII